MARTYAKDVHLQSDEPIAYEQQDGIKQPFAEAHRDYVNLELVEAYEEQTGRSSGMVSDDAMTHDMRPDPEIAAEQDRQTFDERWEAERDAAQSELLEAYAEQVTSEQDQGRENDRDHELSL